MDAPLRQSLKVRADIDDSIAPCARFVTVSVFVGNILLVTGNRLRSGVASLARIEV
jgi:hypothetical protein